LKGKSKIQIISAMDVQSRMNTSKHGRKNPGTPEPQSGTPSIKLQLIQAFRGIAAILVVCYHAGSLYSTNLGTLVFNNLFKFGHTGVTFFFVLSGFIIYFVHSRDLGKADRLPNFFYKRLTRIYPLYWFVLLIKLISKPVGIFSIGTAIFLVPVREPAVSVSWTLSFEMLFYLSFGILVWTSSRKIQFLFISWLSVIVVRTAMSMAGIDPLSQTLYTSFFSSPHILEFVLGGIAGHLVLQGKLQKWRLWILLGGLSLYAMFSAGTVFWVNRIAHESGSTPYDQAEGIACYFEQNMVVFFGIPSFLIILGAGLIDRFGKARVPLLFRKIGDASYSIYLVHATIINSITLKLSSVPQENLALTVLPTIAGAILAGYAVHLIIEKPMLAFFSGKSDWVLRRKPAVAGKP
jgi:exopolysaccharide production protein ExoZ